MMVFYLLEADAHAQVDALNTWLKQRYMSECVKKGKAPGGLSYEQWLDATEQTRYAVVEMRPGSVPTSRSKEMSLL